MSEEVVLSEADRGHAYAHFDDEGNHLGECYLEPDVEAIIAARVASAAAENAELRSRIEALCDEAEAIPPLHSMIPLGCVRASELRAVLAPAHDEGSE